jgi:hypothetical protein
MDVVKAIEKVRCVEDNPVTPVQMISCKIL